VSDFIHTRSNPRRAIRRTNAVSAWWVYEFRAALRRGNETAKLINELNERRKTQRRDGRIGPALM
jgi:hypothetical protein